MSATLTFMTALSAQATAWRPGDGGSSAQEYAPPSAPPCAPPCAPHVEVFAPSQEASGAAAVLAFALDRGGVAEEQRPWLWVQDREALRRGGRPYRPGLPRSLRDRLIHVAARTPQDALFALEEGLRCRDLAFVIGEITGNPRALSMTASRRLSLAVEKHGVPLWLVRLDAARDLSSARQRWQVRAAASPSPRWNPQAPGQPSWQAELFRSRAHPPGAWVLRDADGLVAERVDVARDGAPRQRA